jgi:hypothetical protein
MKLKFFLLFFICSLKIFPQNSINILVFPAISSTSFSALIPSNELQNNVRIFCVDVSPQGIPVVIKGTFEWKKVGSNVFLELGNFETNQFISKNFCNEELGTAEIPIKSFQSNQQLIDENLQIGVPSGVYRINLALYNFDGTILLAQDSEELSFLNPAQTLQIINPRPNLFYDPGNLLVEWTSIAGADDYFIKANTRSNPSQSLEEALNSGIPLVNNKSVGLINSVNLREILERELEPSSEVVIQVSANVPGPLGGNRIFSQIVNFNVVNPENPLVNVNELRLRNILRRLTSSQLLALIENNQLNLNEIRIVKEDNSPMTIEELVNFLESNFENILRIEEE